MKLELENYEGFQAEYSEITAENQHLRDSIEELQQRQQQNNGEAPNNRKEELKHEIKKLF